MNKFLLALLVIACVSAPLTVCADVADTVPEETLSPDTALEIPLPEALSILEAATSTEYGVTEASSTPSSVEEAATSTNEVVLESSPISITLEIQTSTGTLFDSPIAVTACPRSPTDSELTVSGYCAILQSGVLSTWTWYGSSAFIDSLNGTSNDYAASAYWNWFSDLEFGMTALNEHELHTNESLLITIGRLPLKFLEVPSVFSVGSSTTITVLQFGFDSHFNPVWEPSAESIVRINAEQFTTNASGTIAFTPTTPGQLTLVGTKNGYLPTVAALATTTSSGEATSSPPDAGSSGNRTPPAIRDPKNAAREFLVQHQRPDGSFPNSLLSDWAAIGLANTGADTAMLKAYARTLRNSPKSVTDFERHAMALQSLNIEAVTEIEYILSAFDGSQFGDPSLINDDIFGIIPLLHSGYTAKDAIIKKTTAHLLEKQKSDGSWEGTDLTTAAIQALVPLRSVKGVPEALARAREYLASKQETDGCFGNSFTTSWSIMAITALGESAEEWKLKDEKSPLDCLYSLQASDGGFEEGASEDTRVWATAYAVPALEGETWNSILHSFPLHKEVEARSDPSLDALLPVKATTTPVTLEQAVELPLVSTMPIVANDHARTETKMLVRSPSYSPRPLVASVGAIDLSSSNEPRQSFWSTFVDFVLTFFRMLRA